MTNNPGRFKAVRSFANWQPGTAEANRAVAQHCASLGLPVFPLNADKEPLTRHGFHDAQMDASPWRPSLKALVGVPTSFSWVLDFDPPVEASVRAICGLLRCEWRELTANCPLIVRTPRGGFHLYWKRTPGVAIRTAAGVIGEGIDTRGHDAEGRPTGYVVAPGCALPDGRRYEIQKGGLHVFF